MLPLGGDGGFGSLFNFLALLLGSFGVVCGGVIVLRGNIKLMC